jgi:DNA (cytosine-5)-methyltransferase 1
VRKILAADLFCGAGGTSTGLALACEELGIKVDLLAVNHWEMALRTHEKNHPWARHLCKSLHEINPKEAVPGGRLDLLIASPECTHHSNARGGRPIQDQMRMSAWQIVDWLSALRVSTFLIENVREFRSWGPLNAQNRPIKNRRGEIYRAFIETLKSLGYYVEERIVNAADHGDPTTRERLFIIGQKSNRPISWPKASHDETGMLTRKKWRAAREVIDWNLQGRSIFDRPTPLSANTLARIEMGLRRFGGINFILPNEGYYRGNRPRSTDEPLATVTGRGAGRLVEPHLVNLRGTQKSHLNNSASSIDKPLPTLTTGNHVGVVEPFLLPQRTFKNMKVDSIKRPLRTIVGQNGRHFGLVQTFLVSAGGPKVGPRSTDRPMNTVLTRDHMALVQPFIIPFFGEREGQAPRTHSVDEPLPTPTSHGAGGLVEPYLIDINHGRGHSGRVRSIDRPTPTLTTSRGLGLVEGFLLKFNRTGGARSVDRPIDTITAKARFGLVQYPVVEIEGEKYILEILLRMLTPRELASAMGFPKKYHFIGNLEQQVRQIGNAVAVGTAKALCKSILSRKIPERAESKLRATA